MSSISTLTGVPTGGTLQPSGEPEQIVSIPQPPAAISAEIVQNDNNIVANEQSNATLLSDSPNQKTTEKPPVDQSVSVEPAKTDDNNETTPKPETEMVQSNTEPEIIQPSLDINPKNVLNETVEEIGQVASDNQETTSPNMETTKDEPEAEEEKEPESGKIDIKELTCQILNIISDDDKQESVVPPPQQLLKKNVELQEFILKLIQVLREKTELCEKLERQNTALVGQAQSLREVISITKDLLGIRNMEVEHLHQDMHNMEERIKDERVRHNTSVGRLNEAMKLNDQLKNEYLVQMDLFQRLRDKYNEKIVTLTHENKRLLEIIKSNGLENLLAQAESAEVVEEKIVPAAVTPTAAAGEGENNAGSVVVDNGSTSAVAVTNEVVEEVVDK